MFLVFEMESMLKFRGDRGDRRKLQSNDEIKFSFLYSYNLSTTYSPYSTVNFDVDLWNLGLLKQNYLENVNIML